MRRDRARLQECQGAGRVGPYSAYWEAYRQESRKRLLHLGLMIALGLPGAALLSYGVGEITGEYPVHLHVGLLVAWLVAFAVMAVRGSRVPCPRCGTTYSRGRGLCNCPQCGLRLLQADP